MAQVYRMHTAKVAGVGVDREVIAVLRNSVGRVRYEEIAWEVVQKLSGRLGQMDIALKDGDLTMCYRHAVNINGVAGQIGLSAVSKVASDVMNCTRNGDVEALSAVIGRLKRVAEASMFSVLDGMA